MDIELCTKDNKLVLRAWCRSPRILIEQIAKSEKDFPNLFLSKWNLFRGNLKRLRASSSDLSSATLDEAMLDDCDLRNANLKNVVARRSSFRGANLAGADLSGGRFYRADFIGVDLSGANLTDADFRKSTFRHVNLEGAIIRGTNFDDSDLSGTIFPDDAQLIGKNSQTNADQSKAEYIQALLDDYRKKQAEEALQALESSKMKDFEGPKVEFDEFMEFLEGPKPEE